MSGINQGDAIQLIRTMTQHISYVQEGLKGSGAKPRTPRPGATLSEKEDNLKKPEWERVAEPSEGMVHFAAPGDTAVLTLCGIPDFLGRGRLGDGKLTEEPVNCKSCLSIVRFAVARGLPGELLRER